MWPASCSGSSPAGRGGWGPAPPPPADAESDESVTPDDLIKYGMSAELIGRFGHLVELCAPPPELLRRLARDEVDRRAKLWKVAGAEMPLQFTSEEFIEKAVAQAMKRPTGARAIPNAVAELMGDAAFIELSTVADPPTTAVSAATPPPGQAAAAASSTCKTKAVAMQ